jgi:hypothetical protein
MDEATGKAMQVPRCGEKDMFSSDDLRTRRQRYAHTGECVMPPSSKIS